MTAPRITVSGARAPDTVILARCRWGRTVVVMSAFCVNTLTAMWLVLSRLDYCNAVVVLCAPRPTCSVTLCYNFTVCLSVCLSHAERVKFTFVAYSDSSLFTFLPRQRLRTGTFCLWERWQIGYELAVDSWLRVTWPVCCLSSEVLIRRQSRKSHLGPSTTWLNMTFACRSTWWPTAWPHTTTNDWYRSMFVDHCQHAEPTAAVFTARMPWFNRVTAN